MAPSLTSCCAPTTDPVLVWHLAAHTSREMEKLFSINLLKGSVHTSHNEHISSLPLVVSCHLCGSFCDFCRSAATPNTIVENGVSFIHSSSEKWHLKTRQAMVSPESGKSTDFTVNTFHLDFVFWKYFVRCVACHLQNTCWSVFIQYQCFTSV